MRQNVGSFERTFVGFTASVFMLVGIVGCGPERPVLFPVKGQVFFQGKPAVGAVVFFHPITDAEVSNRSAASERPVGRVQEDGSFEVTTFSPKDGAPVGQYRVSVVWTKPTGKGGDDAESLLASEFSDPARSGLPVVKVRPEVNVLPPFQLGK